MKEETPKGRYVIGVDHAAPGGDSGAEITIRLGGCGIENYAREMAKIPSISEAEAKRAAAAFKRELHRLQYEGRSLVRAGSHSGKTRGVDLASMFRTPTRPPLSLVQSLALSQWRSHA